VKHKDKLQSAQKRKNSLCEDLCSAMKTNALVRGKVHSAAVISCQVPLQNEGENAKKYDI
jgi:hypothetical protein